ncbi:MAG TPA: hypothetical protein DIU20_08430 [Cryomorphaceae bacterium]|nr:hypothetical protein [Cryomorphaceae bacterium]
MPELVEAGVISPETAERIRSYYVDKHTPFSPLFIVFGIIGAILVGLGIILIIAHNWDTLSLDIKTTLAFLPLVSGQLVCVYALLKKTDNRGWREGGATFLVFAVGAGMALISQIYHIPGELDAFMLSWLLLILPLPYIMRSTVASLLYIVGAAFFAADTGYWYTTDLQPDIYWLLLLGILPYYYWLAVQKPGSNSISFHNWLIPVSVLIALGTLAHRAEEFMFIAYFSLFGLFYLIGSLEFFEKKHPAGNGYRILGATGTTILLLVLSFDWFWEDLRSDYLNTDELIGSTEFWVSGLLSIMALVLLIRMIRINPLVSLSTSPIAFIFLLFIPTFIIGLFSSFAVVLVNCCVLLVGIMTLRNGIRQDHLGLLNYGLLIISILAICRFFDRDLSFVARGILFVSVGVGFFLVNYYTLKKRRHEN